MKQHKLDTKSIWIGSIAIFLFLFFIGIAVLDDSNLNPLQSDASFRQGTSGTPTKPVTKPNNGELKAFIFLTPSSRSAQNTMNLSWGCTPKAATASVTPGGYTGNPGTQQITIPSTTPANQEFTVTCSYNGKTATDSAFLDSYKPKGN